MKGIDLTSSPSTGFRPIIAAISALIFVSAAFQADVPGVTHMGLFRDAGCMTVDPAGVVYVVDAATSQCLKLSESGEVTAQCGGYGWSDQSFDHPSDITAPNGLDVYVADYGNHRIQRYDRNLNFISSFSATDADGRRIFGYPRGVACSDDGALFIIDGENQRIVKVTSGNTVDRIFGDATSGPGRLKNPARIRVDSRKRVYVLDEGKIVVYDAFGVWLRTVPVAPSAGPIAVEGDSLYFLDGCRLNTIGGGTARTVAQLPATDTTCSYRDFTIGGRRLYLLTPTQILGLPLPEPADADSVH